MSFRDQVSLTFLRQERTVRRIGLGPGAGGDWSPAADFNIFQIVGGPIKITNLFGHVTAVFAGANPTPRIDFIPVGGVANPMCVIAVAAAFALNSLLVWDGSLTAVSGVLRESAQLGHNQSTDSVGTAATATSWAGPILCIPGIILIDNGGALDNTGMVDWYISYIPLTEASNVVPV